MKSEKLNKKNSLFSDGSEDVIPQNCVYYTCPRSMEYFTHKKGDHHEIIILRNQKLR